MSSLIVSPVLLRSVAQGNRESRVVTRVGYRPTRISETAAAFVIIAGACGPPPRQAPAISDGPRIRRAPPAWWRVPVRVLLRNLGGTIDAAARRRIARALKRHLADHAVAASCAGRGGSFRSVARKPRRASKQRRLVL